MKFIGNIKFFGLALILGVAVCPVLIEKANADPVAPSHGSFETSPHDGTQIVTGQSQDQLTVDDNTPETKDMPSQLKVESEV